MTGGSAHRGTGEEVKPKGDWIDVSSESDNALGGGAEGIRKRPFQPDKRDNNNCELASTKLFTGHGLTANR